MMRADLSKSIPNQDSHTEPCQTILLTEDNPASISLLFSLLEKQGYKIYVATTGNSAIKWLDRFEPDLILLDIDLPDMSGYELCEKIKQKPALSPVPVIFMTSHHDREHKIKGFDVGGIDYITKPFNEDEVIKRVQAHIALYKYTEYLKSVEIELESTVKIRTQALMESNKKLQRSEAKYRRFLESIETEYFVYVRTKDKQFEYLSSSILEITGYQVEDFIERFGHKLHNPNFQWFEFRKKPSRESCNIKTPFEIQIKSINDTIQYLEVVETPIHDNGEVTAIEGIVRDITARKDSEDELCLAASVFNTSTDGIMITDSRRKIIRVNTAFSAITGFSSEDVLGKTTDILEGKLDVDEDYYYPKLMEGLLSETIESSEWQGELWNRHKNGPSYPVWVKISLTKDEGKVQYIFIISDISEKKKFQSKIHHMAHFDSLTNLPNRLMFQERAIRSIRNSARGHGRTGIIFIDIDNFKIINDSKGHPTGDRVLIALSERLNNILREEDTLARLGGDEFVVLMEYIKTPRDISSVAEKITHGLVEPIVINEKEHFVSVSMGISLYPEDGKDLDTLVKNADAAMYVAKNEGRNTYRFYTHELTKQANERFEIESAMHSADKNKEFELYYQPQVNIATNEVTGVEALIRWHHPTLGFQSPDSFIPIAEESHLILDIGLWVIQEAIKSLALWKKKLPKIPVMAINIASKQLQEGKLVNQIKQQLEQYNLPAGLIELELTERILMPQRSSHGNLVINQLDEFRKLGGKVAIDDFGTGFSSLNYLKSFPIDTLKIDKSFIDGIAIASNDRAIAEAIINFGKTMGLKIVAEGIETQDQSIILREMGCHEGQGYWYSKPLSSPDILKFLLQHQ